MFKKFFRLRNLFILAVIIILGVLIYKKLTNKQVTLSGKVAKTFTVKKMDLKSFLSLSGNVDATEKATVQFAISGKLNWVGVKEGDYVKKYQLLATLDQRELQKSLEKDLRDYLIARWNYDQNQDDNEGAYTGSNNIYLNDSLTRIAQKYQFTLDKSVLDVELANLAMEQSRLFSPIDGVVTNIEQPFAGVYITPSLARITIVNPETIYLRGLIDQQDVINLTIGKKADLVFDAFPNKTYSGTVTYLSFAPETGEESSYVIKISVPDFLKKILRLGMGAEASILTTQKKQVLAIPLEALIEDGKKRFVYILDSQNKEHKQTITTGLETDEFVEIKTGLKNGEIVVY